MALARDASSPARATSVTGLGDTTTASFTAPSGALLVAIVEHDSHSASSGIAITVTDSGGLTWTTRAKSNHDIDAAIDGGGVWIATAVTSSAAARTVRAQFASSSGDGGTGRLDISVHVITGQHATPIGATLNGTVLTTNNSTPTVFTSTAASSMMLVGVTDWSQLGTPTSTDLTDTGADYSGAISVMDGYKTLGATGSQTVNIDFGGSGAPSGSWAAIEVVPATGGPQALTGKATIASAVRASVGSSSSILFRSVGSTTYASRTNTVVTAPAGIADNDILLAAIFVGAATTAPTPTPPSGFTQIGTATSGTDGSFNGKLFLYWKRAASESGDYTFTHSAASSQAFIAAYSGCLTTGSPVDVSSSNGGNTSQTSTATSVTTTANNDLVLYVSHDWEGSGAISPPAGMTERFDGIVYLADVLQVTAGATGSKTQTNGNTDPNPWAAWLVALKLDVPTQALTGKATISQRAKTTVSPAARVGAKTKLASQVKGTRTGTTSMGAKATVASQVKQSPTYSLPLGGAAATIRTRVSGLITQFKFLAIQTRFSPSMRGTLNTTVPLQTSASSPAMFSLAGSTSRTTALSGQATAAAQSKGAPAGTTLLSGLTKAVTRAGSTIAGSVILAIQTRISPAMRGALNSAVLPTAIALAAVASVISRARATASGQTSLSGQTSSTTRASSGLKAVAYIAGKTVTQTRAAVSAVLRSSLVATGALRSAVRGAMGGTLPLLGRTAVAVAARAGLPIAVALAARALAALKGTSAPSAITAITGRSTLRNRASAQVRLTTLIAALARVSSAARATSSAAVALSTAARATLAFAMKAAFSGTVSLAARTKATTAARVSQGFSLLVARAVVRTSARALLFVLRPVIPTPVYPRPGRLGRLRASLEKAFGEEFDIDPMTAGVDTNSRVMPDISRDALIDVIGIWQGPTTTRAPIARGSIADDKAHNWNASYPSVRFDDAAVAGTRKGDILTRKLDGATYRIERMVPDGFGRTTAQLTARQRTTN